METELKERTETDVHVEEAPTANLPAVHQERRPRAPAVRKPMPYAASIAKAVLNVSREIGTIQKDGFNSFQKYKYTRWEDINEKLSPLLQLHGLIIVQSEINRSLLEENDQGSVLAIVYHFTLVNGETGEQWPPIEWTGIARLRDSKGVSDDKAATKCHTQAEKFFCVKQFKIVTDDVGGEDRHQSLPKKDARDIYSKMQGEIDAHTSLVELGIWGNHNSDRMKALPPDWQGILRERFAEKKAELQNTQRVAGEEVVWDDDHDPETGELNSAPRGDAVPAAPVSPPKSELPETGAATSEPTYDEIMTYDKELEAAAKVGSAQLQSTWKNVPRKIQPSLKSALDNRHKVAAAVADKERETTGG